MYIVVTGDPIDGLFFYGPFLSHEEATEFADREHGEFTWWVADLEKPDA